MKGRSNSPSRSKAERKVLQNLARELKIRSLEEEERLNQSKSATTLWQAALGDKDNSSQANRITNEIKSDFKLTNIIVQQHRIEKLKQLYLNDEIKYENELELKGLAYRRDRL